MNKRKLLTLAMTLCMVAILAVGGTLAYFTADDSAENVFTVGNVKIDLTEPNWRANGEEADEVYPGEALPKDPTVTNIGLNPCFVRVKVTGLDCLSAVGAGPIQYRNAAYAMNELNTGWVQVGDYFYYEGVLAAGEKTATPCFTSIVMPTDLTNGNGETEYTVDVFAEAVQAQGARPSWTAVQAMKAADIAAWFADCGLEAGMDNK